MDAKWMNDGRELLYGLAPLAEHVSETICKKYRSYHNNDKRHLAKLIAKRRKRNKNIKTHRRWK